MKWWNEMRSAVLLMQGDRQAGAFKRTSQGSFFSEFRAELLFVFVWSKLLLEVAPCNLLKLFFKL